MQVRSEETRSRILKEAEKLFNQHGYDATGVAEICIAAGVSKGAFYHHFPTKQSVFLELLHVWLRKLDTKLEDIHRDMKHVPQSLLEMTAILRDIFQTAQGQLPIFLEFWTQSSRDPKVWQETIAPYRRYQSFFTSLVQQGISEGSLNAVDAAAAGRVVIALAIGLLLQGLMDPQATKWDQTALQGMQFLMSGIQKKEIE